METIEDIGKFTFQAILRNSVKKFSNRPCLTLVNGTPVTFKELGTRSEQISRLLEAAGLTAFSKVAIWGTGRPEWGISYMGIVNRRMIAVPLLPDFSESEISSIIDHCGLDAIIVDEKLYEKIQNLTDKLPPLVLRLEDFAILKGDAELHKKAENRVLEPVEVEESDTASIIYTSGTTGRSKGVELTHKNLVWNAVQGKQIHRVNKYDRALSFLPLSHVYEFTVGFTMMVLNGACVYYLGKPPVVSALLPAFKIVQPTVIISVPLVIEKIFKNKVFPTISANKLLHFLYKIAPFRKLIHQKAGKELKKTFGGHLIFFGLGGAKLDPKVERFLKEGKIPYATGYGLTETSPLICANPVPMTILGTTGVVYDEEEVFILNKDPKTGIGEIVIRGPNLMKGYYKDPELTKANMTTEKDECGPGFFKTGDLGKIVRKKGVDRLCLKGRCKNMILGSNGENIYPEDLEFVLNQHPLVSESLVVEDDDGLVALVQMNEEALQSEAEKRTLLKFPNIREKMEEFTRDVQYQKESILSEIQYFVNTKISKNSRIGKIRMIKQFEKTASQKIKRYLYDLKTDIKKKRGSKK